MPEPRVLPLTAAQAGLLAEIPAAGRDPYVAQLHVDIAGSLEPEQIESACRTALDKVPNLRAAVDATSARTPVLVLGPPGPSEWTVVDLRDGGDPDLETCRLRTGRFDVSAGDLVRFAMLRLPHGSRIVLTFHHLLLDGWSAGLLMQLVLRCLVGGPATPAPPPVTRLLRWQAAHGPHDDVWSDVLDGARPGALTTALAPAPPGLEGRGAEQITLPDGAEQTLREIARSFRTTVATVLQAVWGVALARAFGRSDVLFAVVDSGRSAPVDGVDEMVGMLVVTTVRRVRADKSVEEAVAALARDVAATTGVLPLSLGAVGERLGADLVADTLVVVDNQAELFASGPMPDGLRVTGVGGVQQSAFPVVLHVTTTPELRLEVQYDRAVVDSRAARMLTRVVAGAVADVVGPGDPCLRPPGPGGTRREPGVTDPARSPLRRVLDVARDHPARPALVDGTGTTTYRELVTRAARVAGALRAEGVRAGDVVAVCLDRSAELAATVLGVRWAGAAYLAIDPGLPQARRRDLVRRSGCELVVTDAGGAVGDPGARAVVVPPDAPPAPEPQDGQELAYVVHTSGSTGATKGVVVPDAALASQLAWLGDELATGPEDRVLWRTSVAFDASVWELWLPLVTGAVAVVADADDGADPEALRRLLGEVTVAQLVPTLLGPVVEDGAWQLPAGLRVLAVGGESFPTAVARHAVHAGGCRVVNLYGPTETTVQVAAHDVVDEDLDADAGAVVPVGHAVPGTTLHVLSEELVEVPEHAVGELWVTGVQLAVGYLDDPARTAATFVASPSGPPGARAYRTGDLAWRGPRGIVVAGRRDRQVKVRGYRVDLGEIETTAAQVPGVRRCVALVRTTASGSRQLAAVAESARGGGGATLDEAGLRGALAELLPAPLVPDQLVVTEDLPTLPSGKPDGPGVAALVEEAARGSWDAGPAADDGSDRADGAVAAVRRAVAHVLDVPDVGPDDDVIALGVDSVTSLGVAARLRHDGLTIAPRDVHGARSPRAIAAVARAAGSAPDDDGVGRVPLTPFVAEQLGRGADRSFQAAVVRVPDGMDAVDLHRLADALTTTHAMLRARLVRSEDGDHLQVGHAPGPGASVAVHDTGTSSVEDVLAAQVAQAARALDAEGGRMLALRAVRGDGAVLLAVVVHHLVVDAVSMRVLLDDLRDAWHQDGTGGLLRPPTSYRTWARAVAGRLAEQPAADVPDPAPAPDPLPRDDVPARRRTDDLPDGLAARVLDQDDVAPERLVLAAAVLALHRVALADGRGTLRTVDLEVEGHGRDLLSGAAGSDAAAPDVSRTVGWFTRSRLVSVSTSGLRLGDGWSRPEDLVELVDRVARADADTGPLRHEARRRARGGLGSHVLVNYLGSVATPDADVHWRPLVATGSVALTGPGPDLLPVTHPLTLDVLHVRGPDGMRATASWGQQGGVAADAVVTAWPAALDDLCTALEDRAPDGDPDDWWAGP